MKTLFFFPLFFVIIAAQAQQIRPFPYSPQGSIVAVAESDSFIYVAGGQPWSQRAEYAALFNIQDARLLPCPIRPDAAIDHIVSDGKDGFFISGKFKHINSISIPHIAHLKSDFSLDSSWTIGDQLSSTYREIGLEIDFKMRADATGTLHVLRQQLGIDFASGASDIIGTDYWTIEIATAEPRFIRHFKDYTQIIYTNSTAAYLLVRYTAHKALAGAPQRDTIISYKKNLNSLTTIHSASYFKYNTEPTYYVHDSFIHIIADFKKEQGDKNLKWYCISLNSRERDTDLEQKITNSLVSNNIDINNSIYFSNKSDKEPLRFQTKWNAESYCEWDDKQQNFVCGLEIAPKTETVFSTWNLKLYRDDVGYRPFSMEISNGKQLLMVGEFTGVGIDYKSDLSRFRKSTLALDLDWNPAITKVKRLFIENNRLFVAGPFEVTDSMPSPTLFAFEHIDQAQPQLSAFLPENYAELSQLSKLYFDKIEGQYLYFTGYDKKNNVVISRILCPSDKAPKPVVEQVSSKSPIRFLADKEGYWLTGVTKNSMLVIKKVPLFLDINKSIEKEAHTGISVSEPSFWQDSSSIYWVKNSRTFDTIFRFNKKSAQVDSFNVGQSLSANFWNETLFFFHNGFLYGENEKGIHATIFRYNIEKQQKEYFVFFNKKIARYQTPPLLLGNALLLPGNFLEVNGVSVPSSFALFNLQGSSNYAKIPMESEVKDSIYSLPGLFINEQQTEFLVSNSDYRVKYSLQLYALNAESALAKAAIKESELFSYNMEQLPKGKYRLLLLAEAYGYSQQFSFIFEKNK